MESSVLSTEKLAYSVRETAAMLSIGLTRTRDAIARGDIKTFRMGRRILVPREQVAAFIAHMMKTEAAND